MGVADADDDITPYAAGHPAEAADGIKSLMSVGKGGTMAAFFASMGKGIDGMKEEVDRLEPGSYGSADDVREVKELLHYILNEGSSEKTYSNGIRDRGRPEGTFLSYFLDHENAVVAQLEPAEVVALRFYTTAAFKFMNAPLRDRDRREKGLPCPLPVTTAFAEEGIKKLRKLNATRKVREEGPLTLWRGMRSLKASDDFLEQGGTELAFMSTTTNLEVRPE